MRRIFAFSFILISIGLWAQPELGYCEQEVDELAAKQLPKALKNWKAQNYREAERYLKKAVDMDSEYADALYLLGDLYVKTRRVKEAKPLWERCLKTCPDYLPELYYYLGSVQLAFDESKKAMDNFDAFLSHKERDRGLDKEVKEARVEAALMYEAKVNPIDFNPKVLSKISTLEDEYLASISPDQSMMFFTRRTKKVNKRDGPVAKVRLTEEFSLSERNEDGTFSVGYAMDSPFNLSYNEGGPSITADNTELYFTVCKDVNNYKNCDIYYSERDAFGGWTEPVSIGDHINTRDHWESQPSVSASGDKLYFASNRVGGKGGLDLYVCDRLKDGSWSKPENLGPPINTQGNEKTPFIHSDSETLYFTSDGLPGFGGYDIFYIQKEDSIWNTPENIGAPINTEDNELGMFVSLDGQTAYFASNKVRANKGWDIYYFDMPEKAKPRKVKLITGLINSEYDNDEDASLEIKNLKTKEIKKISIDKETGRYAGVVKVDREDEYIVSIKKKGAAFSSSYISGKIEEGELPVQKTNLSLAKIEVGREYNLNDINFDSKSYRLNKAAKSIVDEFVLYLKENPGLKADIQGHTDNVGNDQDNMNLSKNRAKSVYDYVLAQGISANRLSHHGYGETRPIDVNTTEEGRSNNRRTVFVITAQ